jgi:hypothetical protein
LNFEKQATLLHCISANSRPPEAIKYVLESLFQALSNKDIAEPRIEPVRSKTAIENRENAIFNACFLQNGYVPRAHKICISKL